MIGLIAPFIEGANLIDRVQSRSGETPRKACYVKRSDLKRSNMMRLQKFLFLGSCGRVAFLSRGSATMAPTPWIPGNYPPTRRSDHIDVYKSAARGEVRVADPYQWLEEYSDETDKWTTSQEVFTRTYLDQNTDRKKLEDALRASMDYAKVGAQFDHMYQF